MVDRNGRSEPTGVNRIVRVSGLSLHLLAAIVEVDALKVGDTHHDELLMRLKIGPK